MNKQFWAGKRVLVTGAKGFVGHSVVQLLKTNASCEIITPTRQDVDLTRQDQVESYFSKNKFDIVINLAGKVGGILANKTKPADFFYENITIGTFVLHAAHVNKVSKTVVLAAGCGYPKDLEAPFKETSFFNGLPDQNSTGYSMAKKVTWVQSQVYRDQYGLDSTVLLPANLYGPHDNFDLTTSHVVPALIRKVVEAKRENKKEIVVWGSGEATREFLYVEDAAKAILLICEKSNKSGPFNLGTGEETSVLSLVKTICEIAEFHGEIVWDTSKPDGQKRRYYDMTALKSEIGDFDITPLKDGLTKTINWYLSNSN